MLCVSSQLRPLSRTSSVRAEPSAAKPHSVTATPPRPLLHTSLSQPALPVPTSVPRSPAAARPLRRTPWNARITARRGGGVLRRRQGARGRRQRIAGRPTEPAVEGRSEAGIRGVNNTADVPEAEGARRGQGLGRLTYYHKSICRRHHTIDTAAYPFIASSILIVIRMTTNNIAYKSFWVISACVYLKKNRNSFHLIFSKHYFLS